LQTNINKVRREVIRIYKSVDLRLKHVSKVCSIGCSHCCHQNIPVHAAEEFAITEYVDQEFSVRQKSELIDRLRNWFRFMNANTPDVSVLSEEDVRIFGEKLILHKIPCPFLYENKCSIYKVRPITCRTFYVVDSPKICKENPGRLGESNGYKLQINGIKEIARAADFAQLRLLPYAVAEHFGVMNEIKRGITSNIVLSFTGKHA